MSTLGVYNGLHTKMVTDRKGLSLKLLKIKYFYAFIAQG